MKRAPLGKIEPEPMEEEAETDEEEGIYSYICSILLILRKLDCFYCNMV